MNLSSFVIPVLLAAVAVFGTGKRVDVYGALTRGGEDGLRVLLGIIPSLAALLTAVSMFRASGASELFSRLCAPALELLGIPAETAPLMLIRPVSGSGALAVGTELITTYGPDSLVGRVAAVMLGSTETTFYTISVYFGAAGISKTRYTLIAALLADFAGFFMASLCVRLLY
jgi:spore maturation protein B